MPEKSESEPGGLWYFLGRATNYAVPLLVAFEVWQSKQIDGLREANTKTQEWRSTIPDRMKIETEKLRLEILATISGTVGVTLVDIQKSQIRMELSLDELKRRFEAAASVAATK